MKKARCRISLQYAKFCVKNVKNEYFYCHLFKTKNILEVYTQNNKKKKLLPISREEGNERVGAEMEVFHCMVCLFFLIFFHFESCDIVPIQKF